ncbi:MAG: 50S ribosomal protein L4 [Chthoniobacterales bacterium]|nr:MAG: 50S ribosomal protein L4 [Chthoniobacterales bacterium]
MAAKVLTREAAVEAKIALIDGGRGSQAVHDTVVAMRAARRSGSANTKTKAEVNLSGAKPWRQKGTGRARAGYKSSPIWRGGGVVFGPKPRDYSKKVSKSVRRLAFQKALSERIAAGDVLTVGDFVVKELKTKAFVSLLKKQTDARRVLVVSDGFDENTYRSARNVKPVQLVTANEVNTEQLLAFEKILVTDTALTSLAARTTRPQSSPVAQTENAVPAPGEDKGMEKRAVPRKARAKSTSKVKSKAKANKK